jgi:hypothetical protein
MVTISTWWLGGQKINGSATTAADYIHTAADYILERQSIC